MPFATAKSTNLPPLSQTAWLPQPPAAMTPTTPPPRRSVLEQNWPGELAGLVVRRYGCAVACQRIGIVEAAHPVPDAAGWRRRAALLPWSRA